MTEQSIFEHILGDDFYNQENRDDINPLLIPDAASKVCDRLSADVTETARNPSHPAHYLRNNLVLISKLCKNDDEHYQVNAANRSVVLRCLEKIYNDDEEDEMQMLINECVREVKMKKKALLQTIKKRIATKREKRETETALMLEQLRKKVKKMEITSGLKFNLMDYPKKMPVWSEPYLSHYKTLEDTEDVDMDQKKPERTESYRLKHVKLGYALMNVGNEEEILTHISYLLKSLSSYDEMHKFEERFCVYLFKSIGKYPALLRFYQEKLFFILEIMIIDTSRKAVTMNEHDFNTYLNEYRESSELNSLKFACESDTLVSSKIQFMFYTLYIYSNFNGKIMHLLKCFDSSVSI